MTRFIKIGGIGVIAAVLGIFIFILGQILPLFGRARVFPMSQAETGSVDARILGADEWGERPFVVDADGRLTFFDFETGRSQSRSMLEWLGAGDDARCTAFFMTKGGRSCFWGQMTAGF
ncbi:MAG: hypothetical protein HQL11_04580 [Candidatus Omnitrophica bacterium]|nr:hypothetical protein [Candidatus Omnitrophota bacterium]